MELNLMLLANDIAHIANKVDHYPSIELNN